MSEIYRLYLPVAEKKELCFNIGISKTLTADEEELLQEILADGFDINTISEVTTLEWGEIIEIGPRKNFATSWSSNMVSVCRAAGLEKVFRVEKSRRYIVPCGMEKNLFIKRNHDKMTECHYESPLESFDTDVAPEAVYEIDMINGGSDALIGIGGISMDNADRAFYYDYFVRQKNRNPTIVEIMDLNNANSEHSRHGFFNGRLVFDGQTMPETLMQIVKSTHEANPDGSVIAFKDNSSAIIGGKINTIIPIVPGEPSLFDLASPTYHITLTAETHNFPTGVAPFPGAETGTGGRIRDNQATGKGGYVGVASAGYCVAGLHIPGYDLPWEEKLPCPENLASALRIEIEASNGASDYGNKFGEPLVLGFTRSFDMVINEDERWGFLKPIMFTGGLGQIDDRLTEKAHAEKGMIIVQVGGPAYRVGFGGGAASSMLQGENKENLDFNAVQRGDAEMEQKMNRVVRACNEMGGKTLIEVIHDQGAGGPANVLKELVEKAGGRINIRRIKVGDPTMSVLEIYVAEYQERNGFLIKPKNLARFREICEREKVNCEVLGEVTGDMRFVVSDSDDESTPVDFDLSQVLGNIPQKTFKDSQVYFKRKNFSLPTDARFEGMLVHVLRLLSVGSKRFLTSKVDRSVTGLVAQQQCCGPLQLPVADVAVMAQSLFKNENGKYSGAATSIGEQPIKMLVDPAAGARMAVGEALTNLVWAGGIELNKVSCSANWMWAPKLPGEALALYSAADAMRSCMKTLGIKVDGGKDSLSMATKVGEEIVKSPRELVISLYASIPDVTKVTTPDFKKNGSKIVFIYLCRENRMGGSALAQVNKQIGNESPDMDEPLIMKEVFLAVQEMISKNLILSGHDRSDGGLITTILEMAFSGNRGVEINFTGPDDEFKTFFSEELGLVLEIDAGLSKEAESFLIRKHIPYRFIGSTTEKKNIFIRHNGRVILDQRMEVLRSVWEETSYQLELLQKDPDCARSEREVTFNQQNPRYTVPFDPSPTPKQIWQRRDKPKVAILRDEGINSDREMTGAFFQAGFQPWDVTMTDLLSGRITLDQFVGLAAVGGFSYADVPYSAKGWASTILFNEKLNKMFIDFYNRPNTFTLGVCNGCQLFGLLGWVPWKTTFPEYQPRFVKNISGRFESRWSTIKILESPAIMLKGMEGTIFGINVAHGEGRLDFRLPENEQDIWEKKLVPFVYVDEDGKQTEVYPLNPNGSPGGATGLCSPDGRHLAMMPHPERSFLPWQSHWMPEEMKKTFEVTPWFRMFQNAYSWCRKMENITVKSR